MGRSVSVPRGATIVCYTPLSYYMSHDEDSGECFGDYEYDVQEVIQERVKHKYPSFKNCDDWLGREDHAILKNDYAFIGVSEYCGLLSIWLVPHDLKGAYYSEERMKIGLQKRFLTIIEPWFKKTFEDLTKLGTASNGESFFKRREKVG